MIAGLPEQIQQQVLELLRVGNFVAAKDIHDNWHNKSKMKDDKLLRDNTINQG